MHVMFLFIQKVAVMIIVMNGQRPSMSRSGDVGGGGNQYCLLIRQ